MRLRAGRERLLADGPARQMSFTIVYTVRATATCELWGGGIRRGKRAGRWVSFRKKGKAMQSHAFVDMQCNPVCCWNKQDAGSKHESFASHLIACGVQVNVLTWQVRIR